MMRNLFLPPWNGRYSMGQQKTCCGFLLVESNRTHTGQVLNDRL